MITGVNRVAYMDESPGVRCLGFLAAATSAPGQRHRLRAFCPW